MFLECIAWPDHVRDDKRKSTNCELKSTFRGRAFNLTVKIKDREELPITYQEEGRLGSTVHWRSQPERWATNWAYLVIWVSCVLDRIKSLGPCHMYWPNLKCPSEISGASCQLPSRIRVGPWHLYRRCGNFMIHHSPFNHWVVKFSSNDISTTWLQYSHAVWKLLDYLGSKY